MLERNVDSLKYRKSTHLSGVDVEMIIHEKGSCILTISDAYYSHSEIVNGRKQGVNVSGKILDGYFIEFQEGVKPMMVNSTNRKTINDIVKVNRGLSRVESRVLKNWVGTTIELYFDENVEMKKEKTGGIRVKLVSPIPNISDQNALDILNESKSLDDLKSNWSKLTPSEQSLPTVVKLKDELKGELK